MVYSKVVQKALKQTWALENNSGSITNKPAVGQSSIISRMIYDIFSGEILKTHNKKGWHFYNRIDGKRVDFTVLKKAKSSKISHFEDLLSTPDETYIYFAQEDYTTFFMRFIRAFEEVIGLKKYRIDHTA